MRMKRVRTAVPDEIDALASLLDGASRVLVFTGAGMSTESGIDDFRSPGGVWSRMRPIDYRDFLADESVRLEDWRRRFRFQAEFDAAGPNAGHRAVAAPHLEALPARTLV